VSCALHDCCCALDDCCCALDDCCCALHDCCCRSPITAYVAPEWSSFRSVALPPASLQQHRGICHSSDPRGSSFLLAVRKRRPACLLRYHWMLRVWWEAICQSGVSVSRDHMCMMIIYM
jgi:hypothetical protein